MPTTRKPGPKPGAPNAGRPRGTAKPLAERRVVLSCRVLPATLATLRKAGPRLGRTLDTMANTELSERPEGGSRHG